MWSTPIAAGDVIQRVWRERPATLDHIVRVSSSDTSVSSRDAARADCSARAPSRGDPARRSMESFAHDLAARAVQ
jgi:hypothetical protein